MDGPIGPARTFARYGTDYSKGDHHMSAKEPERRSAAKLLTKDEARPIAANSALPLRTPQLPLVARLIGAVLRLPADADVL